jgi:hypothetical protein
MPQADAAFVRVLLAWAYQAGTAISLLHPSTSPAWLTSLGRLRLAGALVGAGPPIAHYARLASGRRV